MLTIGLVGGIATGKSEVGRLLAARGATVVDADRLAHETYAPGTPGYEALLAAFGPVILTAGQIDRAALGSIVFNDPVCRKQLTDIIWPLVRRRVEDLKAEARQRGAPVFAVEAPLLIEAGWHDLVDEVWLVRAPRETARQRLVARNHLDTAAADLRLAAQPADTARMAHADAVINNDGDLTSLERQVDAALNAALTRVRS